MAAGRPPVTASPAGASASPRSSGTSPAWWSAAKTANSAAASSGPSLAPRLDPASGANRVVLQSLARDASHILADRVERHLADGAAKLSASNLRVVFCGHFSSGKSSMINMLIRQPLLPTSNYPETGVPCVISTGAADNIRVVAGSQKRSAPFSTDSIAASVSLIGADGDYRPSVRKITRLDITLAASPIGPGTVWVDSPGIDDTAESTARAADVAKDADVLIWVVDSRQPMSELEQAVLRDHIAARGPASVVFIVNAFLEIDTPERWESFLKDEAPTHQARIEQAIDSGPVPKRIIFSSARAAAAYPDGFGGPEARALLAEMTGPGYWRATATRSCQVKAELTPLRADLDRQVSQEEARLGTERTKQAKTAGKLARNRENFVEATGSQVRQVLARQREAADAAVRAAAAMVDATARTANFYGQDLTTRLQIVADATAADIAAAISDQARKYGLTALATTARRELTVLLAPEAITIVADMPANLGKSVAIGAGTGFAAGTVVPVLGHAVGLVGGAIVGGWRAKTVKEQRLSALRTEVRQAGNAAVTTMCGSADGVLALVERAYPHPTAPPEPDQRRLTSLREAQAHLSALAAALSDAADGGAAGDGAAPKKARAARAPRPRVPRAVR